MKAEHLYYQGAPIDKSKQFFLYINVALFIDCRKSYIRVDYIRNYISALHGGESQADWAIADWDFWSKWSQDAEIR